MKESPSPRWTNYTDFSDNLDKFLEFYKEVEAQYLYLSIHFQDFYASVESQKEGLIQVLKADQILNRYPQTTLEIFERQVRGTKELKELLHNQKVQSRAREKEIQLRNEFLSIHEIRRFDLG